MVSIDDNAADPMAAITDLAFAELDVDIRRILHVDGALFVLDRIATSHLYMVHRGTVNGPPWVRVGDSTVDTPADLWSNGSQLWLLANRSDIVDLVCRNLPASAKESSPWGLCGGSFEYDGGEKLYSVGGKFVSDGSNLVNWRLVRGLEQENVALFALNGQKWSLLDQFAATKPASWSMRRGKLLLGYVGKSSSRPLVERDLAEPAWILDQSQIPVAEDDYSGVVAMCTTNNGVYALYFDYAPNADQVMEYSVSLFEARISE